MPRGHAIWKGVKVTGSGALRSAVGAPIAKNKSSHGGLARPPEPLPCHGDGFSPREGHELGVALPHDHHTPCCVRPVRRLDATTHREMPRRCVASVRYIAVTGPPSSVIAATGVRRAKSF